MVWRGLSDQRTLSHKGGGNDFSYSVKECDLSSGISFLPRTLIRDIACKPLGSLRSLRRYGSSLNDWFCLVNILLACAITAFSFIVIELRCKYLVASLV